MNKTHRNIILLTHTHTRSAIKCMHTFRYYFSKMNVITVAVCSKKTKYLITSTYEHRRNTGDLRIGNKTFETVQSFQYLGNVTSNTNNNNKCIKERIMLGNKAYYANRHLFNSSLISRSSKLQIYRTLVRPVVTYSHLWFRIMDTHRGRGKSISSI